MVVNIFDIKPPHRNESGGNSSSFEAYRYHSALTKAKVSIDQQNFQDLILVLVFRIGLNKHRNLTLKAHNLAGSWSRFGLDLSTAACEQTSATTFPRLSSMSCPKSFAASLPWGCRYWSTKVCLTPKQFDIPSFMLKVPLHVLIVSTCSDAFCRLIIPYVVFQPSYTKILHFNCWCLNDAANQVLVGRASSPKSPNNKQIKYGYCARYHSARTFLLPVSDHWLCCRVIGFAWWNSNKLERVLRDFNRQASDWVAYLSKIWQKSPHVLSSCRQATLSPCRSIVQRLSPILIHNETVSA